MVMHYVKKNLLVILIILLTFLLLALVIWTYNKRIESIEKGTPNQSLNFLNNTVIPVNTGAGTGSF